MGNVLIYGSSHIAHFERYLHDNGSDPGLNLRHSTRVFYDGGRGRSTVDLYADMPRIEAFSPEILFLVLGGNDLGVLPSAAADAFTNLEAAIVHLLRGGFTQEIVISQVLPRYKALRGAVIGAEKRCWCQ